MIKFSDLKVTQTVYHKAFGDVRIAGIRESNIDQEGYYQIELVMNTLARATITDQDLADLFLSKKDYEDSKKKSGYILNNHKIRYVTYLDNNSTSLFVTCEVDYLGFCSSVTCSRTEIHPSVDALLHFLRVQYQTTR